MSTTVPPPVRTRAASAHGPKPWVPLTLLALNYLLLIVLVVAALTLQSSNGVFHAAACDITTTPGLTLVRTPAGTLDDISGDTFTRYHVYRFTVTGSGDDGRPVVTAQPASRQEIANYQNDASYC
jgi:hypothetical protein